MKQVTVYSTAGQNKRVIETTAATWGELQNLLADQGVSYSGMKAVVGETQVTLESNAAMVPDSNFTLFLLPQKVKSGLYGFDEDCDCDKDEYDDEEDDEELTPKEQVVAKVGEIQEALDELVELINSLESSADPKTADLRDKAAELKRNLGIFE